MQLLALESCDYAICTCTVSIFHHPDNVIFSASWTKALLHYGVYPTTQCMPFNQCNITWNVMPQSQIFVWKQPMMLSGSCLICIIPLFFFSFFFPVTLESIAYLSLLGPELSLRLMTGIGLGHLRVHYHAKHSCNCECVYCTVRVICVRVHVFVCWAVTIPIPAIKQMHYLAVAVV